MQSILASIAFVALSVVLFVLKLVLVWLPLLGWLIGGLLSAVVSIGCLVLWLYLMHRAYSGDEWEIPLIGEHARRLSARS